MTLTPALKEELRRHYGLAGLFEALGLAGVGRNNVLTAFRTPAGAFVLKRGAVPLGEVQAREFELLAWLADQDLGFAVPSPLRTLDGAWGWEDGGLNVLLPFLTGGALPEETDAWRAFGAALRALHDALARYPTERAPWTLDWMDLQGLHPRVPDPLQAALARPDLWGGEGSARAWRAAYEETTRRVRGTYAKLPRTLVHGDFNSVNVLYEHPRVTAVLDFEFACVGARVLDVATALMEVLVHPEPRWTLAKAFLRGYGPLSQDEVDALAAATLLRQAALGVWSVGQVETGALAPEAARARLVALPELLAWLGAHEADLTRLPPVGARPLGRFEEHEAG